MNTDFLASLAKALSQSQDIAVLQQAFAGGAFPFASSGLKGSWLALFASLLPKRPPLVLVTANEAEARELAGDLNAFGLPAFVFPSDGNRLYQPSAANGERAAALLRIADGAEAAVVPLRAFLARTAPPDYLRGMALSLQRGQEASLPDLAERLAQIGYLRVPRVSVPGEFAVRGEVVDIFAHNSLYAARLQFAFDEIEEIKLFNVENQMSVQGCVSLIVPPAREALFSDEEIDALELKWNARSDFSGIAVPSADLRGAGRMQELFMPLLFDGQYSLLNYLPEDALLVFADFDRLQHNAENFAKEIEELYKRAIRQGESAPKPAELFYKFEELSSRWERRVELKNFADARQRQYAARYEGPRSFFGNIVFLKEELAGLLQNGYRIVIFAENEAQALRIGALLTEFSEVEIVPQGLSGGFCLPQAKFMAICEHEIFGRKKRERAAVKKVEAQAIESFIDLSPGDFIVHANHGVGRFKGIERLKTAGTERDYISLEYAEEDTVFVPIEQVNLVQRYIGADSSRPKLDKIGGRGWSAKKARAQKSAEELSDFLLQIYAKRQTAQGFAFPKDDAYAKELELEFEARFPYEETPDQLTAMEEIKADMESPQPMDRLLCGDVGYGKTELAMRAAFKAVIAGKQAVLLCPTTILAEQHFENFKKRFAYFEFINIRLLSRYVNTKRQKETLQELAEGKADLLIGTHRLLSKDVAFKNLGLLVVDEEQRFGVKDKEKIKQIKSGVDCLTMSATPIPRTLHMSLVKIRDLSMLKTPPASRHPVETFVDEYNAESVQSAIRRELARNGQVFYLHNRVESLEAVRGYVASLVPEAMVDMAHGKMSSDEMDEVMHRFIHGGFSVLVSTTIIESGIDIPNVNTIIIDRADMYGISQLYQLRGRVGRSDRVAYAYLFYPEKAALSELAMKRLQIISDFTELGSGFKIAMKDMEVRGAGNLLGREQSGQIQAVGFDLYLKLLDEAIRAKMRQEGEEEPIEPYLELEYSGFIPDSYIADAMEKMEVYKKIAGASTEEEAHGVYNEVSDRFGPIPDEAASLFSLAEIKALCRKLRVNSIKERGGRAQVEFAKLNAISIDNIMRLIKESAGKVKPDPANPAALILETGKIGLKEKSEFIRDQLARL